MEIPLWEEPGPRYGRGKTRTRFQIQQRAVGPGERRHFSHRAARQHNTWLARNTAPHSINYLHPAAFPWRARASVVLDDGVDLLSGFWNAWSILLSAPRASKIGKRQRRPLKASCFLDAPVHERAPPAAFTLKSAPGASARELHARFCESGAIGNGATHCVRGLHNKLVRRGGSST
ncbi:MAG TPA: hypothetical protein VGF67_29605 [Ktedonobacteraceae bacterium]